jgi:predicted dehydrogenase
MEKIHIGVIGCGYWGPNLIRNFDRAEGAELRWICDKDQSRLDQVVKDLHLHVSITTDYHDLLDDEHHLNRVYGSSGVQLDTSQGGQ